MATIVEVIPVPNRILEAVKARILANRRKQQSKDDDDDAVARLRGATRPRVQIASRGASLRDYRRPEPAATRLDGYPLAAFRFFLDRNSGTVQVSNLDGNSVATASFPNERYYPPSPVSFSEWRYGEAGWDYAYEYKIDSEVQSAYDSSTVFAAIPAGGTKCVIFFAQRLKQQFVHTTHHFIQYSSGYVGSPFDPENWDRVIAYNSILTPLSSVPSRLVDVEFSMCFVVDKSFAKFIEVPPAMAAAFEPFLQLSSLESYLMPTVIPKAGSYTVGELYTNPGIDEEPGSYLGFRLANPEVQADRIGWNWGGPNSMLPSYASSFLTPGVFTVINHPEYVRAERELPLEQRFDLQYIGKTFLKGVPLPLHQLYEDTERSEQMANAKKPGFYTGYVSINAPDSARLTPNREAQYPFSAYPDLEGQVSAWWDIVNNDSATVVDFAWDWGRPRYCLEQLKELGITDDDLAPPEA